VDRRRPGRPAHVSPHLLPLLRGTPTPPRPNDLIPDSDDDLPETPFLGIISGVLISSLLWCLLGVVGWMVIR
jgi:hypothetical protein